MNHNDFEHIHQMVQSAVFQAGLHIACDLHHSIQQSSCMQENHKQHKNSTDILLWLGANKCTQLHQKHLH